MPAPSLDDLQRYLRSLCDRAAPPDDAVLLKRFVEDRDREAFELLVARHGPMVLGTARRLAGSDHDAEDVFQAVFLSFARLAKGIRQERTLPAWLHSTTCRIAARNRQKRGPRPVIANTDRSETREPSDELAWREVRAALDEELQRLPEKLRAPLLLCYLSGLARDEAARELGWSLGTLKRRLEEGRKTLRTRLERRGIGAAALAVAVLTPEALQAKVSQALFESSLDLIFAAKPAVPEPISSLALAAGATTKGLAMKSILVLLAITAVGVGIYAGTGQADSPRNAAAKPDEPKPAQQEQVVQTEDPLPAGSTLRFGTSRFRYGTRIKTLAVSPDGKTALAANDNDSPRVFDLATGRVLFSLSWGDIEVGAFSPDGRTIVAQQGYDLCVFDAASGKALRQIKGPLTNSWSHGLLVFTPDGKAVGVVSHEDREPRAAHIHLVDLESGKTIRDFSAEKLSVMEFAFSPDGKLMASGGYDNVNDNYFARLWDVETGKELRRFMHGKQGYGIASLAFSPDGKTLATLGTQAGVLLRLFDVDTGKVLRAFPKDDRVRPERGSVAFAPDGKTVAAATNSIRLYDTTTGEEQLRIDRRASDLHFSDDGKTLTAAVIGAIYRWDTATGKSLIPEGADNTASQIHVTADGSRVITCDQYSEAHVWDGANGKYLRRFQVGWQSSLAMSPDGRFLAWLVSDESVQFKDPQDPRSIYYGSRIRLYDIVADQFVDRFPAFKGGNKDLAFTSDGKKLVTADQHPGMVRIWNFAEAKEERSFSVATDAMKKRSFHVGLTQLSSDGKTVAVTYVEDTGGVLDLGRGLAGPPHELRLWDVASGTELPKLDGGNLAAFSPDGRFVVTRGNNSVYEIATGNRIATLPNDPMSYIRAAAFSRDGRYLAIAVPEDLIQIWEVATWTKRSEFKGIGDRWITLTFGPGGRLYTGHHDTTVLVWDVRIPVAGAAGQLEMAWNDLAVRDASQALKPQGQFLAAPAETVKLFAEKIQPAKAVDARRIEQLIGELNSPRFAAREAASKELVGLYHQAVPRLEKTLATTSSPEVRQRIRSILGQGPAFTPAQVRDIRAVQILELLGTLESKTLLAKWAGGPAGEPLTVHASAALKRLETTASTKR
ncbi:MAG: sigma-70 family RNA polymerase sigma factor [Gemmataceae bacterium]